MSSEKLNEQIQQVLINIDRHYNCYWFKIVVTIENYSMRYLVNMLNKKVI